VAGIKNEKILVVDDDIYIRGALKNALSARNYEVILADSGEEALEMAALELPDIVILDLSMPGLSGLQVCKDLRSWSNIPIIILSVIDKEKDKIEAFDLGVDDYITKPFKTGELLARLRAHIRRAKQIKTLNPVFEERGLKIDFVNHLVTFNNEEIKITKTEFSILKYLIQNSGKVITYKLLISEIWGTDYDGDISTLRVHVGNLRKKIEEDLNRPKFIITEPRIGYRFYSNQNGE